MRHKTEQAFREADKTARLLGDMKHGIHAVKTTGGISEKTKLEALMGFRSEAEKILSNMGDRIAEAIYEIDKETQLARPLVDPNMPAFDVDGQEEREQSGTEFNLRGEHGTI